MLGAGHKYQIVLLVIKSVPPITMDTFDYPIHVFEFHVVSLGNMLGKYAPGVCPFFVRFLW